MAAGHGAGLPKIAFRGGAATTRLAQRGLLSADNLTPQKARILPALALTVTAEPAAVAKFFAPY